MSETKAIQSYKNPELVVLRNPVARAKFGLSLVQTKFLFEVLAFFKDHPEARFARFYVRDYLHKLGVSSNNFREYVQQIEDMRRRDISIPVSPTARGLNFIGVSLFSSAEYRLDEMGDGYIEIEISDKLKPYFLEIAKGDFFYYHILNTRVLRSTYSIKLYLLLKSYRRFGKLEIPLEELRNILEINPNEYKLYKNFKARVLETARLEMEEKNDICFRYEDIRRSRKSPVEKIVFYILDNPNAKEILEKARKMFEQDKIGDTITATPPPKNAATLFDMSENMSENMPENMPDTVLFDPAIEAETTTDWTDLTLSAVGDVTPPKPISTKEKPIQKSKIPPQSFPKTPVKTPVKTPIKTPIKTLITGENREIEQLNIWSDAQKLSKMSAVQTEIIGLFRLFDKDAPDTDIIAFIENYDSEKVLDVLYYAKEQIGKVKTEVKNIYPYLVAGIRTGYGKGLTARNRLKMEKEALKLQQRQQVTQLKTQLDNTAEAYEKAKNEVIRVITTDNPETTALAIEAVKKTFAKINPSVLNMTLDDFRLNPMYREFVKKEIYEAHLAHFKTVDSQFLPEIEQLKKAIQGVEKQVFGK